MLEWSKVTGLFGGTFDPPHVGHLQAVLGLYKNPGLKKVVLVPSAVPPQKKNGVSIEHRIEMTKLTFIKNKIEMDLCEIERPQDQPTYAFETILALKQKYPPEIAFVIGSDQLEILHTWRHFPEILTLCNWIILERNPHGRAQSEITLQKWESSQLAKKTHKPELWVLKNSHTFLKRVSTLAPDISSTEIREQIAKVGNPPPGTLTDEVLSYLIRHQLYGTHPS